MHEVSTIRVDNVYQYESSKDKQAVFHLRVLIKSLLEELNRLKREQGVEFVLDEGILALVREQILDDVEVEDILSRFRPPAKIVQVPVVVETPVPSITKFEKGVTISAQEAVVLKEIETEIKTFIREEVIKEINSEVSVPSSV